MFGVGVFQHWSPVREKAVCKTTCVPYAQMFVGHVVVEQSTIAIHFIDLVLAIAVERVRVEVLSRRAD